MLLEVRAFSSSILDTRVSCLSLIKVAAVFC